MKRKTANNSGKQRGEINCQEIFDRLGRMTWEDVENLNPVLEEEITLLLGLLTDYMEKEEIYRLIDSCFAALNFAAKRSFLDRFDGQDSSDPLVAREIARFEATWVAGKRSAMRWAFNLIIGYLRKCESSYPLDPNADVSSDAAGAAA